MIDIHCHPLYGVDDGADSLEESVAMCQLAAADGVTDLVATPHCNYSYAFDPEVNRAKVAELQAAVGDTPRLLLGCDFHLSYDNIQKCIQDSGPFTINRTSYLLVELPEQFISDQVERVFYDLQVAGLTPIVTHPERNPVCQRRPELIERWAQRGCLMQVTAQSYTGDFGSEIRELSEEWVQRNLVNFFASDAHDTEHRPPILSKCYRKLAEAKGEDIADLLLARNPEAVIHDRPLPAQPPIVEAEPVKRGRRWFEFFRR